MLDSLRKWFEEYTAVEADDLFVHSDPIKAVASDEPDADFIERRIRESAPDSPVVKGFCAKCQYLFDHWPSIGGSSTREHDSKPDPDIDGWEHTVARSCSTFELESLAREGCRFCAFLLQCLKDCNVLDTFRKIEARLHHLGESATPSLSIQNWGTNPTQLLWLNLPGKICTSCNAGIALEVKSESCFLPASADCYDEPVDVLDIARNWLSACSGGHELCKSNDDGALPTRLISITGKSAQLVLTSELSKRPQYATLSHCWGSEHFIKLTSKDLDSFMKLLPVERLPETFKDAFNITKVLGLDFIWIDSLCIIQDDVDDWQKESALMSSVYGGSTITIAASSAPDSTQGCFLKQPCFSGGFRARITDGGRQRVQDFRSSDVYNLSTFGSHLGTRAWALQEKLLPPRTIHFGDRGAFWECRTTIASEYLPDGFPRQLVSPLVRREGKFDRYWPQIVRIYSAANLTFGKDKLPALSGIARLGHNETGDRYLAGLWRGQIEEQLCWHRCALTPGARPPWRAPTWSWASIDAEVTWVATQEGILETRYAHVLDASTTQYGYDPFGQVTSGVIRLACSAMAVGNWARSKTPNEAETGQGARIVIHADNEEREFPILIDCLHDGYQKDDKPVHLLPLLGGKTGRSSCEEGKDWLEEFLIEGIVLQATGVTRGEFSRIGSFNFYKNGMRHYGNGEVEEETYDPFLRVLEKNGTATAEAACAETTSNAQHPSEQYIITLI